MRILGLDYGDKTIGVAVSDPFGWTAQGVEIIKRGGENEYKSSLRRIEELINEYNVEKIVLGYPLNLNGTVSDRCVKTEEFKEKMEKRFAKVPVILWDERLSTVAAAGFLAEAGLNSVKRKNVIDKMAAVYILQGYLNSIKEK
ncbi:MAG: Holliday junction resolvase RuvX [Firmicutes bacterium]|nr:Holliday junction resolvase RuvX [Bacillota bacterium]